MKWIGITGGIGSGKSTFGKILREKGFHVIDADEVAHRIISKGTKVYDQIIKFFGEEILDQKGNIRREFLAEKVFNNKESLYQLESIVHPEIQSWVSAQKDKWRAEGVKFAFYDVPLLFEKKLEAHFDYIVVVSCSSDVQFQRLIDRGYNSVDIRSRIENQLPLGKKVSRADFLVENNGSLDDLRTYANKLIKVLELL